jgi:hypothetical protein
VKKPSSYYGNGMTDTRYPSSCYILRCCAIYIPFNSLTAFWNGSRQRLMNVRCCCSCECPLLIHQETSMHALSTFSFGPLQLYISSLAFSGLLSFCECSYMRHCLPVSNVVSLFIYTSVWRRACTPIKSILSR